jgi:hypothetical protein
MEDPVTLPTSGVVLDRSTITAHLLGENRDPFNRKELKIEDVIPSMYHCINFTFLTKNLISCVRAVDLFLRIRCFPMKM